MTDTTRESVRLRSITASVYAIEVRHSTRPRVLYDDDFVVVVPRSVRAVWTYRQRRFDIATTRFYIAAPGEVSLLGTFSGPADYDLLIVPQLVPFQDEVDLRAPGLEHGIDAVLTGRGLRDQLVSPPVIRHPKAQLGYNLLRQSASNPDACVGDVAAAVGLHSDRFGHIFRLAYGVSPTAFRQAVRLASALRLLRERLPSQSLQLAPIAQRAGYYDQSHMARNFRKLLGVSPTALLR